MSNPVAVDIGNMEEQSRLISQTMQFPFFTTNANAVWASQQYLRKISYPFATIQIQVNRDEFRLEVGDCFRFSYAMYGISEMIFRVINIQEAEPDSEVITVEAGQDVFSASSIISTYTAPTTSGITPPDYTDIEPFDHVKIIEAPYYVAGENILLVPMACRKSTYDLGFSVYMSVDGGASYSLVSNTTNIFPYATLVDPYPLTYSIDDEVGMLVDFVADANNVITSTWPEVFSGSTNMAILGDEFISFQSITPVSGTQYLLEGIIRGRYGSVMSAHSVGEELYVVPTSAGVIAHSEIIVGAQRKFKYVPYNIQNSGDISEAIEISLTVSGIAKTPYIPINLTANDGSFAARYDDDIVLDWSARKRAEGAGIGIPGVVLPETDTEGLFEIEVWKDGILKRTVTGIDATTWTYTADMNLEDSGAAINITEDFEGSFPPEGWTTSGNAVWTQTSSITPHSGTYCAMSGDITDSESSYIETTASGNCVLTFWWKVSSELDYDYLQFYINDVLQDEISGGA